MDKTFSKDVDNLNKQLRELGERARKIIEDFVEKHGGRYSFDNETNDIYVGRDFVTHITTDALGRVYIHDSAWRDILLYQIDDLDILELAERLNQID